MIVHVKRDSTGFWNAHCEKPYMHIRETTTGNVIKAVAAVTEATGHDSRYNMCWHFRSQGRT